MKKIVGIAFNKKGKIYNFDPNYLTLNLDDYVVVETERGLQTGVVVTEITEIDEKRLPCELKQVVRLCSKKDLQTIEKNVKDAKNALEKAIEIAAELELDMKILDASYSFDRKQLLFNFLADERVDFRELAKRLAALYKTRIELRQIGVRDKAKEVGGLGPCGRVLCCHTFLNDMNSVTINMAKNQMLALNPTKINGCCGRLLCCLGYEDEVYTELRKNLPNIGEIYNKNGIKGKVIELDIFKKIIKVQKEDDTIIEVDANESTK